MKEVEGRQSKIVIELQPGTSNSLSFLCPKKLNTVYIPADLPFGK